MDKDQVIQSLSTMLQKRNNDIINLELQVAQLTTQLNANKEEEKKEKKNEEQDIRTVQAKKSN
jgi:hypothetical protein